MIYRRWAGAVGTLVVFSGYISPTSAHPQKTSVYAIKQAAEALAIKKLCLSAVQFAEALVIQSAQIEVRCLDNFLKFNLNLNACM